jgi:predicted enzyme related to lactoylglutathione lyase
MPHASEHQETYGLTHFAILVSDVARTLRFYKEVFHSEVMYEEKTWAQIRTPGSNDILVFEQSDNKLVGKSGGIVHFGFRLRDAKHITAMIERIKKAGGEIREQGEFVPGSPYVFFKDPDGYEIEKQTSLKRPKVCFRLGQFVFFHELFQSVTGSAPYFVLYQRAPAQDHAAGTERLSRPSPEIKPVVVTKDAAIAEFH